MARRINFRKIEAKVNDWLARYVSIHGKWPQRNFINNIRAAFTVPFSQTRSQTRPFRQIALPKSMLNWERNIVNGKMRCPKCRKMRKFFAFGNKAWKQITEVKEKKLPDGTPYQLTVRKHICNICRAKEVGEVVPVGVHADLIQ
jgi:hypothetical protein